MNLKQKKATSSEPSIYVHTLDRYDLVFIINNIITIIVN